MSINDETLRLLTEMRVVLDAAVDTEAAALVRSWARAWDEVVAEWEAAASDVAARRAAGEYVSTATIRRMQRAGAALAHSHSEIVSIVNASAARFETTAGQIIATTSDLDLSMLTSQLPDNATQVGVRFNRISTEAVTAIVERTSGQITSRAWPLADDATEAMLRELVAGVPAGRSPREAAARMVRRVEGRFNGGLPRALTIARTEMVDAYRTAAYQQQFTNRNVLAGWVWLAALDGRTCPACIAMHGTEHPITEPGPLGHQNCRCARMPSTKSWAELGFDQPEPPSLVEPGEEWFARQPEATRRRIMGPERLAALDQGVPFEELVTRRSTPGWRDSFKPTPARDLTAA